MKNSEKEKKIKKNEYTVIKKYNQDGESFQKVMEKILINKLNNM